MPSRTARGKCFGVVNGRSDHVGVILSSFFMTQMDTVTQNTQLVSSLLQSYWLSTSEYLTL